MTVLNERGGANLPPDAEPSGALTIEDVGDGVVRLVGDLDMETAPTLQRYLELVPTVTVLDLREVTFVDSCCLTVLVRANRDRPSTEPLILRSPNGLVRRVLEITGLVDVFRIDAGSDPT